MADVVRSLVVGTLVFALSPVLAVAQTAGADSGPPEAVTFSKDIAPILQRSCQKCHRPNSLAPMSLISYEEVRPWARAIKHRTGLRDQMGVMPPWYIREGHRHPAIRERPLVERRGGVPDRGLGRQRRLHKAIPATCRPRRRSSMSMNGRLAILT